jgi:hypothetical protein
MRRRGAPYSDLLALRRRVAPYSDLLAHAQDGCAANYTGRMVVRGNSLGFLVTGDLEFSGGQLLDLSNNMADFVQQESIKVC